MRKRPQTEDDPPSYATLNEGQAAEIVDAPINEEPFVRLLGIKYSSEV